MPKINVTLDDLIVVTLYEGSPRMYVFEEPSDTWTITHNLNRKVIPQIYTMGGLKMEGNILHLNNNTLQITFTVPMSGYVVLV